jgi:hypothetical protein
LSYPGGDGTVALEPTDAAFDGVAGLVQLRVEGGRAPATTALVLAVADLISFLRLRTSSAFSGMVHRIPHRRR